MRHADAVLHNARITTMDAALPTAQALAISDGKIVAVGASDDVLSLAGPRTQRLNAGGRVVLPGLSDAHIHLALTAQAMAALRLHDAPSKAAVLEAVAERARATPPGTWIVGQGWAQASWDAPVFPTAADLDVAAPDHPVYLAARSLHAAWVNSVALRAAGLGASTPDPAGGQLLRDDHGLPTGILLEPAAMSLVRAHIPTPDVDALAKLLESAQAALLACGITSAHDFDPPVALAALQVLRERGALALRVTKQITLPYLDAALEAGLRFGFGDDWLRIGALKMFADGALGPRTAAMLAPYDDDPANLGMMVMDADAMRHHATRASRAGLPSTIHAIGDCAVRDVLDVFAAVRADEATHGVPPSARRHRVEHVQLIQPDDVPRLAALGLVASMQPIHATADRRMADRAWGARAAHGYNPRAQWDAGAVVAFGSDSPVESFDPWAGLHAAVTRRSADGAPGHEGWHPHARVRLDEALHAYTQGAAYAVGQEGRVGVLRAGALADLIVLADDPFALDPHDLHRVRVAAAMVGGVWRFGGV